MTDEHRAPARFVPLNSLGATEIRVTAVVNDDEDNIQGDSDWS